MRGDTEIVVIGDGYVPDLNIDNPRIKYIFNDQSIGQRASVNKAARMIDSRYMMKLDAHCSVDAGFDVKLMKDCEPDWTVIPRMYNLHAFDWECTKCGNRIYQDAAHDLCAECGNPSFEQKLVWLPRWKRRTDYTYFDRTLKFKYWYHFDKRPNKTTEQISDVMGNLGACWLMRLDRFRELEGLDEKHGSWGQVGVEISCKSWLSGGRQVVNKNTWFAHLFRTTPSFGFPYDLLAKDQEKARVYSRDLWLNDKWEKQKYPLSWLVDKFSPVPTWDQLATEIIREPKSIEKLIQAWSPKMLQEALNISKQLTNYGRSFKDLEKYVEKTRGQIRRQPEVEEKPKSLKDVLKEKKASGQISSKLSRPKEVKRLCPVCGQPQNLIALELGDKFKSMWEGCQTCGGRIPCGHIEYHTETKEEIIDKMF